jgi:hypothetical protein
MTWPKAMFNIEVYDHPKKGDWHKAKYCVHAREEGLWTDNLDDALQHLRSFIIKLVGEELSDDQLVGSFIMKPAGKVKLKALQGNGEDSKWHTVTGYMLQDINYYDDEEDATMFMMFTSNGLENSQGVTVRINGELSDNLTFKDCNSGKPLTAKQAVDIILGNVKPKQPTGNENGRHNDKKADRRKVQKVRPVRNRVKRDSKLVRLPDERPKDTDR